MFLARIAPLEAYGVLKQRRQSRFRVTSLAAAISKLVLLRELGCRARRPGFSQRKSGVRHPEEKITATEASGHSMTSRSPRSRNIQSPEKRETPKVAHLLRR